jgi:hypothetical protein
MEGRGKRRGPVGDESAPGLDCRLTTGGARVAGPRGRPASPFETAPWLLSDSRVPVGG